MAEARLNKEYALRIAGVGVMMLGMSAWSVYDGAVGWPRKNSHMDLVRPALLATNLTVEVWIDRKGEEQSPLEAAFAEKGLKTPSKLVKRLGEMKLPESAANDAAARTGQSKRMRKLFEGPVYSSHDLKTQYVQAVITLLLGLLAFSAVARKAGRRFVADEAGLRGGGFGGQNLAYDDLAKIDWSKWDEKGIVTLWFKSGQKTVLDGWHFAGMTGIAEEISRHRPDLAAAARRKAESGVVS